MARIELNVGSMRLVVNDKDILFEKVDELIEKMGEVNLKHSPYSKYPMHEGESHEDWYDRVLPEILDSESKQKEGESVVDYVKRIHTQANTSSEKLFDALKAIAEVFGQPEKVTPESFKKTSSPEAQNFVVEILKKCKLSTKGYE